MSFKTISIAVYCVYVFEMLNDININKGVLTLQYLGIIGELIVTCDFTKTYLSNIDCANNYYALG